MEVSLLDPPEPGLVLLVHSCLAYTQAAYSSWMLVYDGCVKKNGVGMIKKKERIVFIGIGLGSFSHEH